MLRWRMLWKAEALFLALIVGCAGIPRVPLAADTGQGQAVVHVPRTADLQPVQLEEAEFQQAVRRLAHEARLTGTPRQTAETAFQMDPQGGNYLYLREDKKLVPAGPGESWDGTLTKEDLELAERYRLWCRSAYNFYGDCLGGALVEGRYLDMQGRYVWALAMSKSPVLDEMKKALGEMVEFRALISAALWTLGSMLLIMLLNPVAPALVAVLGVGMLLYVGYDTLRNLVTGWGELTKAAKAATTFEEIREAGKRFGKIIGREAARAFALLLVAAIGSTARLFAAKVPTLPGSAQVAMQAEGQAGIALRALGAVQEIAVTAEGMSITLPANAVAMAARPSGGKGPCVETHHIATICNDKDPKRGGPWTPRFRKVFAKAGMSMEDPANKMPLPGHYGPHPERYHQIVFNALDDATRTCRSVVACRAKLMEVLKDLAKDIATPGTELNQLVTRQ
ncbi:AHH domain-containing protein [Stigmatella erecta]|uniref:A nuclease family of the HNH/ENDO VII superfamily with conserved AHH n=1 Tax=Stigmatella erecta TaxID=83460 RepID=A0A1I0LAJ3_9BACT|nr:AHH domain-containing protein [Stigmatella erecta]SEU36455.1 A nuclease family of the HNH/ENDO VII superfamily with conserved AHH [Stigmatella erecta]